MKEKDATAKPITAVIATVKINDEDDETMTLNEWVELEWQKAIEEICGCPFEELVALLHDADEAEGEKERGAGGHQENAEILDADLEKLLKTKPMFGLTADEVAGRLQQFGPNELTEKKSSPLLKFLGYFGGGISILLEIATIIAAVVQSWIDVGILSFVLVTNAIIGFMEEAKAENALDALKNTLASKTHGIREGALVDLDTAMLVPGDIIALRLGDVVPADCRLLGIGVQGNPTEEMLHIDQSALTGESLAVKKGKGAIAYSSSIVKQGQMLCVVTKTGPNTYIGRAATLMQGGVEEGHFQKIVNHIGNFLIILTVTLSLILLVVKSLTPNAEGVRPPFMVVLKQVLILTIAAIPVGLPTVLSVTMAVGAKELAKKQVIVKRLPAIEELASVTILCSDKTGTLTLNELTFDEPYLSQKGSTNTNLQGDGSGKYTQKDILLFANFATEPSAMDAIEFAVRTAAENGVPEIKEAKERKETIISGFKILDFMAFNPDDKYSSATVLDVAQNKKFKVVKGAPHVIIDLCGGHDEAHHAVLDLASRGLRALGVAKTIDEDLKQFEMIGMISLLDPPRPDSAETIRRCMEYGVSVKMITGDQLIIAKEVAARLGMPQTILNANKLADSKASDANITMRVVKADGFAQVIPEHKYKVVDVLQKKGYMVAMTGDGVNDAPALKKADVGIAVHGCTDAARSAADIVLMAPGLSTIVDGITTSRGIFQRMRSYSVYRITSTIHFLIFFFITLLVWDFALPDRLIIMIAVLNDAATLVISVDNTKISRYPDKWRLGQLLTLSTVLGLCLVLMSFIVYFVGLDQLNKGNITADQLGTIMYLQVSSCPHFVIFTTRVPQWFWENIPSPIFLIAVGGTQVIAMFMSIYGLEAFEATAIGWGWGVGVIASSLFFFLILDFIKTMIIRHWSFELTAKLWPSRVQLAKLAAKKTRKEQQIRYKRNLRKVRNVVKFIFAAKKWKSLVNSKKN